MMMTTATTTTTTTTMMMMMMMMLTMMIHSRFGPSNVVVGAFTPRLPSFRVEGKARAPSASRRSWGSGNEMSEASVSRRSWEAARALAAVRPLDEEIAMLDDAERHRPRTPDPFEEDGNIRSLSPESSSSLPPSWYRRLSSSLAPRSNRAVASVRFLGFDERGWQMLRVPGKAVANGTTQILQVTVGDKTVELVQQQDPMKVYVNPKANGFDECETPPGSGFRLLVGSPSPSSEGGGQRSSPDHKQTKTLDHVRKKRPVHGQPKSMGRDGKKDLVNNDGEEKTKDEASSEGSKPAKRRREIVTPA